MQRRNIIAGIALAATATLALAGCATGGSDAGSGEPAAGDEYDLIEAGTLTVCSDIPYAPFEFEGGDNGTGYTGFDIDLLDAIAKELDLKLSVQDVGFDALQSGTTLAAGQCDVGASAMTITDERKANIDFSEPYYESLQSLLVRTDSGIESIDDLSGKNVGVQQGTTGEAYATENAEGAELVQYPSDGELWPAMQAGQIDAILQDQPVNLEHEKADSAYKIVEEYETGESYGFAYAKGEKDALREAIDGALQDLRDSGDYQTIYDTYFTAK
ncbi:ABC transporter substrate-binding protein [Microbacterium sp. 1.5R]|uniref:transporter substrate-binding domain-containing protein n=1 Tax=Microbacterium TaxID=33882 RepID=UPI00069E6F94|nr:MULTISPECIES: transporter substrate-binding domain-containing protein [unclassified Microbacterium]AKV87622.1 ABC transporter substrate-binding protein [Microbacterium sp. CGR1]APH44144.1 ABC transporter substrate-binding protein [Microbacterium sp. 1.5R]KRD54398.1 ABC transporter substrate-binding protein [Microbacterium sp. Root280D1]MBC6495351.1 ABC transporter substrate-binding protein [Microbacterium sp. 4-7]MDY0985320.1 transporter substrate-binding domain-containing protein [Microbac